MSVTEYGNESIELREGAERVRKAPHNFLGSDKLRGAQQTVIEILGNATDERLSGFGDELIVTYYKDGAVSIRDFGRGVPLGFNKKVGKWNYFLIYEELFAGGKYEDNQEILKKIDAEGKWDTFNFKDYPYLISIGMHGVGGACSQYTSEYFEVISYRDGNASRMYYEKGRHVLDELEIYETDEKNGTFVKWLPDIEVFEDVNLGSKWLEKLCKNTSVTSGFKVTFVNEKKGTTKVFEGKTIKQEMNERSEGAFAYNSLLHHSVDSKGDICVCEVEAAVCSSSDRTEFYNNMIEINGGSHSSGLDSALYVFFSEIAKDRGMKVKASDYSGKLSFLIATLTNKMSINGQTKDFLDDAYVYDAIYKCVYNMLKLEHTKGTSWLEDVINDVMYMCELRVAQENLIKNNKEIEKVIKKHKLSDKFCPCRNYEDKNSADCEMFIVEGDSAGGRAATARDQNTQCILAIRGKSLNLYKASIEQLVANAEIRDLITALGCGIDLDIEGYDSFDINKLRIDRIYFMADADVDGKHINMLLFLLFYKLFPELLYQGHVYIVEPPLYIVASKDNKVYYCMSEQEMSDLKNELGSNFYSVDRFKGLGEMSADSLWETSLSPENRKVRQIKLDRNDTELIDVLEVLFGKSTERRKDAILGSMMEDYGGVMASMENLDSYIKGIESGLELEEVVI